MNNLARICSGLIALKFEDEIFFYSHPSPKTLYKADLLEQEIIENNKEVMDYKECLELLYSRGKWSDAKEKEVNEEIPKIIEDIKTQIYVAYVRHPQEIVRLKEKLNKIKNYLYKLLSQKHSLDAYTIEGIAKKEKTLYLLKKRVEKLNVKPIYLLGPYYSSLLSEGSIREVARSEDWQVKWIVMKKGGKVFSGHLNDEQERLVKWSTIYDNIMESPEPPPQEVLNDDDALDGYFLYKQIENKDKQKLEEIENRYAQKGIKFNELYLPAANMEEARRNDALNSPQARQLKNARFEQINNAKGDVKECDLKDQRLMIDIAKNQLS